MGTILPFIYPDNLLLFTTCCQNQLHPRLLRLLKAQRQYNSQSCNVEVSGIEPLSKQASNNRQAIIIILKNFFLNKARPKTKAGETVCYIATPENTFNLASISSNKYSISLSNKGRLSVFLNVS